MDIELSNMMEGIEVKTDDEIAEGYINDISLSNQDEVLTDRTDKAEEYFLYTLNLLTIKDNFSFEKLSFIQKMFGVITLYYNELFEDNWQDYYIRIGMYARLEEIKNIKEMMELFLSFQNREYDRFLMLLKNIYIQMFIINEVFEEYHHL
mgnify:FL=1|tara:strand:+ start:92 stop:541 length:450 start_codon:yes stop_codon:yes gene_type:complete